MNRLWRFGVPVLCLFFAWPAQAESIRRFAVEGTLQADRSLTLTESITYDFEEASRHGIFRVLPDRYERNGARYRLNLSFDGFTLDDASVPSEVTNEGGNKRVRLGDPEMYVTGVRTYRIRYHTRRAVNDLPEHQELYWNVNGNGWQVDAQAVTFALAVPANPTRLSCFVGSFGSEETSCTIGMKNGTLEAKSTRPLRAGEGLTIVAAFPLGTFVTWTWQDQLRFFFADNWIFLSPIVVCLCMYTLWRRRGKEPDGRGVVIAQYEEPRKMTPLQMMALRNQHIPLEAITGEIFDLGRRGYLKIVMQDAKTFSMKKMKEPDDALTASSRLIYDGIFDHGDEVTLADLKGDFWKPMEEARVKAFEELKHLKLFGANPAAVRAGWIALGVAVGIVGVILVPFVGELFLPVSLLNALIIVFFGWHMPRKTVEGAIVREEIEGLKKFLSVTETERLKFFDAPHKTPEQFSRFLPAAIALGVETAWAKQFEGMQVKPTYVSGTGEWNAMAFANTSRSFHTASAASAFRAPSSAGSGSSGFSGGGSGGGFGGGGGGSW